MAQREQFPSMVAAPAPAPYPAPVPGPATYAPAPTATMDGTIQPAPPWDPYGTAGSGAPGLLPPGPSGPAAPGPYYPQAMPGITVAQVEKFLQCVRFDYHYFAPLGSNPLGINDMELSGTFALPLTYDQRSPLLVTPGFAVHWWQGPNSVAPAPADMPAETYDAYLDVAWNPQFNCWFGAELSARVGAYSDFRGFDAQSVRVTGTALGVVTLNDCFKIKAGVWYLNRVQYKLLPSGGVVWTPNPDVRFDILFPNPKLAQHLTTIGNTEWWWYLSGNYGGGTWTIKRGNEAGSPVAGELDQVDYNDIRVALGLESKRFGGGLATFFEVGVAFDRQLVYSSGSPSTYSPSTTMFLRGGLTY
jgi:hypothetical protein